MKTAATPPSAPGFRRPPSTASRPSTTTCSRRAARATCASAPAPPASPRPATRTSRRCAAGLGAGAGRARATTARLARRDRLPRLLPLLAAPCATATWSTPAPGVVARVLAGDVRRGRRAGVASAAARAGADAAGRLVAASPRARRVAARGAAGGGQGGGVRGRGGAGFPAGAKWEFARAAPRTTEKFIVANGDEGDPGSYIDKYLMERSPALLLEGMALAGYAVGARTASCSCAPSTRARSRRWRRRPRRAPTAGSATTSSAAASPST